MNTTNLMEPTVLEIRARLAKEIVGVLDSYVQSRIDYQFMQIHGFDHTHPTMNRCANNVKKSGEQLEQALNLLLSIK